MFTSIRRVLTPVKLYFAFTKYQDKQIIIKKAKSGLFLNINHHEKSGDRSYEL